jgi:hypothetical protein
MMLTKQEIGITYVSFQRFYLLVLHKIKECHLHMVYLTEALMKFPMSKGGRGGTDYTHKCAA